MLIAKAYVRTSQLKPHDLSAVAGSMDIDVFVVFLAISKLARCLCLANHQGKQATVYMGCSGTHT